MSVWKADLTEFKVDAAVNAANINLRHGGGFAKSLCEAGGQLIQKESDHYIEQHGPLQTGDAVVTSGGSLPCSKVIHAVGPSLRSNPTHHQISDAKELFLKKKAVENVLNRTEELQLRSVAMPAISYGILNFPLQICANVMVSTITEYHDQECTRSQPLVINLVNQDDLTVEEMGRACKQILCAPSSHSQEAGLSTPSVILQVGISYNGMLSTCKLRHNISISLFLLMRLAC